MENQYYIYIMSNKKNGTLYVGVTNNLVRRVFEHKNKVADGFTSKYSINNLVYYEIYEDIENAILREKQLKNWRREKKVFLINKFNKEWIDLYSELIK